MDIRHFILVIISSCVICGCKTDNKTSNKTAPNLHLSSSIDSLGHLINLTTYRPESVMWTVVKLGVANDRTPGPTDYNLQAIMTFDSSSINAIKTNYKLLSVSLNPKDINPFRFNWLPQDYTFAKDSGDAVTYQPSFFKSSPYLNGGFIINKKDILLSFYTQ